MSTGTQSSKTKLYLVNSPTIKADGIYQLKEINKEEFRSICKDKHIISAIRYESTLEKFEHITAIPREQLNSVFEVSWNEVNLAIAMSPKKRLVKTKELNKEEIELLEWQYFLIGRLT